MSCRRGPSLMSAWTNHKIGGRGWLHSTLPRLPHASPRKQPPRHMRHLVVAQALFTTLQQVMPAGVPTALAADPQQLRPRIQRQRWW